jgi:hypothetical protein
MWMHVCLKNKIGMLFVCSMTNDTRTSKSMLREQSVNLEFKIMHVKKDVHLRKIEHLNIRKQLKNHT